MAAASGSVKDIFTMAQYSADLSGTPLAKGSESDVFLGKNNQSGERVAMKVRASGHHVVRARFSVLLRRVRFADAFSVPHVSSRFSTT